MRLALPISILAALVSARRVPTGMVALLLLTVGAHASSPSEEQLSFDSNGVTLSGTLVMPADGAPIATVVFVHGSGPQQRSTAIAHAFAKEQIAALVYDKRGVGESGGKYEAKQPVSGPNLALLADDARAALDALLQRTETQDLPAGLVGISQAGWIVPLAAKGSRASFIVLWSGPVCAVSEEDIFSKYTRDKDLDRVPAFDEALAAQRRPYRWPAFLGEDINSAQTLASLDIPGLWVFGAKDGSIPVDLSLARLDALVQSGHAYDYVLFSALGHNNIPETFLTVTEWIKRAVRNETSIER
ncbi:MAG: alpha/beta fold hydrolase [Pseudomonadota bacterium]